MWVNATSSCSESYQSPSLLCGTGCGPQDHWWVWQEMTSCSDLGFYQTLISRVPVNYLLLYVRMSLQLFLCYTQRKLLVNCDKWRIVFTLASLTTGLCKLVVLHLSVCMFMYKCYLMLISVNTVDPTFTFILHGARVRATSKVSHNFRYGNTSMASLLDIDWYMPSQKLCV